MSIFLPRTIHCDAMSPDAEPVRAVARGRRRGALRRSLGALAGSLLSLPAMAALSDTLHPFAAIAHSYEDNLLRLPDNVPGLDGARSDTVRRIEAGLLFERPIGRQVLSGHAKLSKVAFRRFDRLDHDGRDALAAWEWHVGNHVEGHLGASYARTLAPFTDFHSEQRNLRHEYRDYVDGAWRFHPSWRARGGFVRDRFGYDLASQRVNNRSEDATELGLDYLAPSDSVVGLRLRHLRGAYPDRAASGAAVIGDGFEQDEAKANIYWNFSGVTQLRLLGGWARRRHAQAALRDASGGNGRVVIDWAPLGKLRFTGTGWREFGVVENALVNSSLNKGASLGARWDATAKLAVDGLIKREQRDFSGAGGVAPPAGASDSTRQASLGLTYAPHRFVRLVANLFHEVRGGSALVGTGGYRANGVALNVSAQF